MKTKSTNDSRRRFLQSSSAVLLAGLAGTPDSSSAQSAAGGSIDAALRGEDYWKMVRSQFSFDEAAVPMNAANLCPSFRAVGEDVARYTADIDEDCSFNNRAKFGELRESARSLVANQLNVSSDEIALVRNTSEANNIINNGLELDRGDEIVLWDQNHPTNNVAWDVRAARFGLRISKVATPVAPRSIDELVDSFTSRFTNRTRVLALTHVSNVSGIRLPVREIVQAAHARGIFVHVDGAQVWGAMNIDLRDLDADSFSGSAHKWYLGPKEVGLLYVKQSNHERIWPGVVAPGWGNDADTDLIGARKFESLGQRDDAALAGLGSAAALHDLIGLDRTASRITQLAGQLKSGISGLGLRLVTPLDQSLSWGVCIARAPAGRGGEIADRLYTEHGIAGAATGGVRLCPTIYNTPEHIDRAVAGLKALMT